MDYKVGDIVECIVDSIEAKGFSKGRCYTIVKVKEVQGFKGKGIHHKVYYIKNNDGNQKRNVDSNEIDKFFRDGFYDVDRFDYAMGIL